MENIRDCGNCLLDNDGDCKSKKWKRAVDNNKRTENKKGECLYFIKK